MPQLYKDNSGTLLTHDGGQLMFGAGPGDCCCDDNCSCCPGYSSGLTVAISGVKNRSSSPLGCDGDCDCNNFNGSFFIPNRSGDLCIGNEVFTLIDSPPCMPSCFGVPQTTMGLILSYGVNCDISPPPIGSFQVTEVVSGGGSGQLIAFIDDSCNTGPTIILSEPNFLCDWSQATMVWSTAQ